MFAKRHTIAVVGAGYFGCTIAIALADAGYEVMLLERQPDIIQGTSRNNTNRVHLGFHYPRDRATAIKCRDGFTRFTTTFPEAIRNDFPNVYCIAADSSLTSAEAFMHFCDGIGLSYSIVDLPSYGTSIRGCTLGLLCQEAVCDADILRSVVAARIRERSKIRVCCGTEVVAVEGKSTGYELVSAGPRTRFPCDAVINCSYSDINHLTVQLGHRVLERQFEYTAIPIIEVDLPLQGITVMDGPFMTLLPYGKTGKFSLYHVRHSVIASEVSTRINEKWLFPDRSPFSGLDKRAFFEEFRAACSTFVPALEESRLCGFLEAPRMVLANHEKDDARPSLLNDYGKGYFTVFSGKIDHCLSIADTVTAQLGRYFEGS